MISCVHIRVCLPNVPQLLLRMALRVVVNTNCAIAYVYVTTTVQYVRLLQSRMHLSASQEAMRSDTCITSTGSLASILSVQNQTLARLSMLQGMNCSAFDSGMYNLIDERMQELKERKNDFVKSNFDIAKR